MLESSIGARMNRHTAMQKNDTLNAICAARMGVKALDAIRITMAAYRIPIIVCSTFFLIYKNLIIEIY